MVDLKDEPYHLDQVETPHHRIPQHQLLPLPVPSQRGPEPEVLEAELVTKVVLVERNPVNMQTQAQPVVQFELIGRQIERKGYVLGQNGLVYGSADESAVPQKVLQHKAQGLVQNNQVSVVPGLRQLHIRKGLEELPPLAGS